MIEALIIAAGRGSRLSRYYSPKPLTPIFGLGLIERIILAGKTAGVRDFKIVVGYKAAKIKKQLGNGKKYNVSIEYIDNPEWEKGNGVSVLKAKEYVQGQFLLLMSDHLFDENIIKKLLRLEIANDHCALCVDKNISSEFFDLDDVTKVQTRSGRVRHIGKSLSKFNAIDTGVFLCTPVLFDALEKSVAQEQYSLSAGNQILAQEGKLETVDVSGCFWVDVDNEEALRKAKKTLIQRLFKPTDGPISKSVNRRLSTRISAHLAYYNISPNAVTLVSFSLAFLAAIFFYLGGYLNILVGGTMAQLSSVLDGCDGEIARLKFKFSTFGAWLDRVLDRYADGLVVLGITHSLWMTMQTEYVWLSGFLALTGTFMNSYTAAIYDDLIRQKELNSSSLRVGRDIRLFIIFIGALCNQLFITLVLLAIITNVEAIRRLFVLKNVHISTAH